LEESANNAVQGIGDMSVGASIHALRNVKGASTISADQQVLSGNVENYRSNLLLNMLAGGLESVAETPTIPVTEQQMIMMALSAGSPDAEADIQALAGMFLFTLCGVSVNRLCRVPPTNNVLHHYTVGGRSFTEQALGCWQTKGSSETP
jgi:hypothetical protein